MTYRVSAFSRRRFLSWAMAPAALAAANQPPQLAIGTYLWIRRFSDLKRPLADGLEEMFHDISSAGFRRMELDFQILRPEVREKTLTLLRRHKMETPIVYYWASLHETGLAQKSLEGLREIVNLVRPLGVRTLNLSIAWKARKERKSDEEIEMEVGFVNQIAREMAGLGLDTVLHNHDVEMLEDGREWNALMKGTDPAQVGACLDIDWIIRAGGNPTDVIRDAGPRLKVVHLRNSRGGVWTQELAEGEYDYASIARQLRQMAFRGFVTVEVIYEKDKTAVTRPVVENLRRSRAWTEKMFRAR